MSAEPPVAQECVEAYLFVRAPLRVLVLRRPPSRASIWVPVSGKVEPSDADLPAALLRELAEETGFAAPTGPIDLDWAVRFDGPDGRPWRLHAYAVELPNAVAPALSPEHDAFEWLPLAAARERLHYEDNRRALDRLRERIGER